MIETNQTSNLKPHYAKPLAVQNYQIFIFEPNGRTINLSDNPEKSTNDLPSWSIESRYQQTVYSFTGVEVWQSLNNNYRIYIKLTYTPLWHGFANPLYALPILIAICIFLLSIIQLRKRYEIWQQIIDYGQNIQQMMLAGYHPIHINRGSSHAEVQQLAQIINRLSFKMYQYFQQLHELNLRQNTLIDNSPTLLFLINRKGRLVYFNEQFAHTFITPFNKDVVYMLTDFITGTDKATQQLITQIADTHALSTFAVTNLQRDMYFDMRVKPYYNRFGQLQGFSGSLEIVTNYYERLQNAWLEDKQITEKLESFNKLWAVLGHELRTPLSGMIGMIDLLVEDTNQLDEEQQDVLSTLQQSSKTMLQLLNDMLDVAKLEAGKLQTNLSMTDLSQSIRQVADLMAGNARRHGISLYVFTAPNVPRTFETDDGRLRQILMNLVNNAVKFTKSGYVAILLDKLNDEHPIIQQKATETSRANKNWLRITIKDTGIGIAEQDKKRLFSYFNQANDSISRQFGGTGLGLAISNNFSQLLGGFIHLESEVGKGSEFQVYLPMLKFGIQPMYQFNLENIKIFIVFISPYDVTERIGTIFDAIDIPHAVIHDTDENLVSRVNTLSFGERTPVFLVDDVAYIGKESLYAQIPAFNNHIKFLMSLESERTLDTSLSQSFDGIIQKPVTVSNIIAEIIHQQQTQPVNEQYTPSLSAQKAFEAFLKKHNDNQHLTIISPLNYSATMVTQDGLTHTDFVPVNPTTTYEQKGILVAEDNPVNQKIAKKHLLNLGYDVIIANDGQEALALLKQHRSKIGLILMDCRMPIVDGIEATRQIRANKDSIPIVALTANDTDEDRNICIEAGMDNFLTKPLNKEKLQNLIRHYFI
ncbi:MULTISPECIES: response regulator [unclassified Moraxella]|uniref:response regulator n=1 Tax=unclassified Moraxella TaxID=2685852 RepID=UPI003AF732F1